MLPHLGNEPFSWALKMAKKNDYLEKLRDPRWQKKRLEVLNLAEFTCSSCHDNTKTLNVHHKEYIKGREPWEYDAEQLVCICQDCHKSHHEAFDLLKWACSYSNIDGPNNREELAMLICGFMGMPTERIIEVYPFAGSPYLLDVYQAGIDSKIRAVEISIKRRANAKAFLGENNG
jgi:hypothetical protein